MRRRMLERAISQLSSWLSARTPLALSVRLPVGHLNFAGEIFDQLESYFMFRIFSGEFMTVLDPSASDYIRVGKRKNQFFLTLRAGQPFTVLACEYELVELPSKKFKSISEAVAESGRPIH